MKRLCPMDSLLFRVMKVAESVLLQRCRLRYSIVLDQGAYDSRVRVRLKGQHFLPAVDNHEAEIQCGLAIRRYCKVPLQFASTE
jgi:hypothetical protein